MHATTKPPCCPAPVKYYQRRYYNKRIKATVEAEYARLRAAAVSSGSDIPPKLPVVNTVAQRLHEAESPEFKVQLLVELDEEYQQRMSEHNAHTARPSLPSTPEEFHRELQAAGHWLPSFAEYIQRRLGMNVSIFLAGPIGENGGEPGVQSVHAGATPGLVPKLWPEFDESAFALVTKSMAKHARVCYSSDLCKTRVLSAATLDDDSGAEEETTNGGGFYSGLMSSGASSGSATPIPSSTLPTSSLLAGVVAKASALYPRAASLPPGSSALSVNTPVSASTALSVPSPSAVTVSLPTTPRLLLHASLPVPSPVTPSPSSLPVPPPATPSIPSPSSLPVPPPATPSIPSPATPPVPSPATHPAPPPTSPPDPSPAIHPVPSPSTHPVATHVTPSGTSPATPPVPVSSPRSSLATSLTGPMVSSVILPTALLAIPRVAASTTPTVDPPVVAPTTSHVAAAPRVELRITPPVQSLAVAPVRPSVPAPTTSLSTSSILPGSSARPATVPTASILSVSPPPVVLDDCVEDVQRAA
ncbi:hypothetical protein VTO73DRAFT_9075 [Trametes versicolor]